MKKQYPYKERAKRVAEGYFGRTPESQEEWMIVVEAAYRRGYHSADAKWRKKLDSERES